MGTTSDKLIYLNETKTQLKDMINYGLDTNEKITNATTFRNYVKSLFDAFIKTMTYPEVLYDNLPKVTGESTSLTLNNTVHAPMSISLKGNTSQKTNLLPSDYTEVDYIESHADGYIDTELVLGSNFNIELAFALTQYRNTEQPIISTWNNDNKYFNLFIRPTNAYPGTNSVDLYVKAHHYTGTSALTLNNIVNINITRNGNDWSAVQDGNETSFQATDLTDNDLTLKIFKRGDLNNACYARVYKLKIYNNDVLVRDFIPCYRNSDDEIGLYDLVNNVFYTNQGTGAFTYGTTYNRQTPSPDYPQNVNVVSENNEIKIIGKNLLDISPITNITGVTNNGDGTITFNGSFTNTSYSLEKPFVLNANTTYTLSLTNTYSSSGSATFILRNGDTNIMVLNYKNESISYTPTIDTTIDTIRLFNAGITFNNYTFSVQLEKGSTATEYIPYEEQTYSINLGNIELCKIGDYQDSIKKSTGKNLFDKDNTPTIKLYVDTTNNVLKTSSNSYATYTEIQPNTTYTISKKVGQAFRVATTTNIPANNVSILSTTANHTGTSITITTEATAKYLYINYFNEGNTGTIDEMKGTIQIEKGSSSSDYEPYGKVWYVSKQIGKFIPTGDETWTYDSTYNYCRMSGGVFSGNAIQNTNQMNTHFPYLTNSWNNFRDSTTSNSTYMLTTATTSNYQLCIRNTNLTNKDEYVAWIKENTPEFYYQLETPTPIEITDTTLITQLDNLEKAYSYDEQTNITQTNNDLPFIISAKAILDLRNVVNV